MPVADARYDRRIGLIGGSPSSGSTLLVALLEREAGILCLPETGLFAHGRDLTCFLQDGGREDLSFHLPWLLTEVKCAEALGWPKSAYEQARRDHMNSFDFVRSKIDPQERMLLVEKTPENVFAFRRYVAINNEARVVVTTRSFAEVCQSLMRRGFNLLETAIIWFSHTVESMQLLNAFPENVHRIHYTDLVHNPRRTVERLLQFFDPMKPDQANDESLPPQDTQISTLRTMSTWQLSGSFWSRAPSDAPKAQAEANLLGLEHDVLVSRLIFTSHAGLIRLADLDRALVENEVLPDSPTESFDISTMSLNSEYTRKLADVFRPRLARL